MSAQDELKRLRQQQAARDFIARRSGKVVRTITGGSSLQMQSLQEVLAKHRARTSGLTPHKAAKRVAEEVARLRGRRGRFRTLPRPRFPSQLVPY